MSDVPPIVELRQSMLHPGRRDELIDLFDSTFVEPQEAVGISVIGQFRNLDNLNAFVWLRAFPDMPARAKGLSAFYGGPIWKQHRSAANATIIDNDNVLLLRPVRADAGFAFATGKGAQRGATGSGGGLVIATIYHLDPTDAKEAEFIEFFDRAVTPLLAAAGAPVIASFVPERSANTFPALPVRDGEHVFVWFSRFASVVEHERFAATLAAVPAWRDSVAVQLMARIREPQTLRLEPTSRSLLHH